MGGRLTIVGHGPSAVTVDGSWLDDQFVVRLKDPYGRSNGTMRQRGITPGTRTDVMCARHINWREGYEDLPFWLFPRKWPLPQETPDIDGVWIADHERWYALFQQHVSKRKPSTGMCAVFCAVEQGYEDIDLVGFDSWFGDTPGWHHDGMAERAVAESLVTINRVT